MLTISPASPDCSTFTLYPVCGERRRARPSTPRTLCVSSPTVVIRGATVGGACSRRAAGFRLLLHPAAASDRERRDQNEHASHAAPPKACTTSNVPCSSPTDPVAADELVAHAARRARPQGRALQRVLQPVVMIPQRGAAHREQRDERARRPGDRRPAARRPGRPPRTRRPGARRPRDRRIGPTPTTRRCQEVIEAPAPAADNGDPLRAAVARDVERELEIGGVLLGRVPLDDRTRGAGPLDPAGSAESRSPTT